MSEAKIPIGEGRKLAEKYNAPMVVVFSLHDGGKTFNVMSYGQTKALCRLAADYANKIADGVLGGSITPSEIEPTGLPDVPTEWNSAQSRNT